ncbi:bifunctional 4-hydroxy-2-oxoglutarate aldolase/2-dehydro-3-deoxy-phosphogluconate aldolase [Dactylosporangium sp. NPDC000244]|uniref:bifunctional 4-hydroxy-2-oxoglutarate aldolase/2-dehydro-3-deoxy-phosphogluconate aldolase n=1 Tax=Dactylosporangium sp. NPDC000244 TaxID=3154365 RepID=UPI00331FACD2
MGIDNSWFARGFRATPFMAILRGLGPQRTLDLARQAWAGGIDLVEVPVQRPGDLEVLSALAREADRLGRHVGAGTVLTVDQLDAVRRAGARFIVSPGLDRTLVAHAAESGIPALPGVGTATEVNEAMKLGLTWLKAFPAASLGSSWISQLRGPFPDAHFVATGGMNLDNAQAFLDAGAKGVAIGSAVERFVRSRPQ